MVSRKAYLLTGIIIVVFLTASLVKLNQQGYLFTSNAQYSEKDRNLLKLYWFIPDGLRAEPELFNIYRWADEGLLPNIKRMMERGSYGYSKPVFPGHTPTNFATLLTGTYPETHGVADGPMHIQGHPLEVVSKSGFSSIAKKVPPIWFNLERTGNEVTLLSVPGSTPPELSRGTTVKGRWGGWGIEFPATIFHSAKDRALNIEQGREKRVFEFGPELTKYINSSMAAEWEFQLPDSFSPPQEIRMENWGSEIYGYITDSTNDNVENYDQVHLSRDKHSSLTHLEVGQWSDWFSLQLSYQTNNDYNIFTPKKTVFENDLSEVKLDVMTKFHIIRLGEKDEFRIRALYDGLNAYSVKPSFKAEAFRAAAGPMIDFVDNYPPQLIYFKEDKQTFTDELNLSLNWHNRAAKHMLGNDASNVIIHDIYSPNQMLTSRWWMNYIDPMGKNYHKIDDDNRQKLLNEVIEMYQGIDRILGTVLDNVDEENRCGT